LNFGLLISNFALVDKAGWNGGMVEWWNGGMVEWWNDGMME
jgi:hypothetical protein